MAHRSNSSSSESVCRIVLLGKTGAVKSRVTRILLGGTEAEGESDVCVIHRGNVAERNVCLVEAPGWDHMQRTPEKVQHEIIRSVTLCSPGPHALILVLPVSRGDVPSENELKAAVRHTELLSERVWNHTVVLFLCDQDVDQATIKQHLQVSGKLLEKCGGRHYVLKGEDSKTQRLELFKEIDELVEENCGDCFLPQVYYELMQSKIPKDLTDLKQNYENREKQLKEAHQKTLERYKTEVAQLKQRRRSMDQPPPYSMQSVGPEKVLPDFLDDLIERFRNEFRALAQNFMRSAVVIMVVIIGALVGSVVGSEFGVLGSGLGIFIGALVTLPIALKVTDAVMQARGDSPPPNN